MACLGLFSSVIRALRFCFAIGSEQARHPAAKIGFPKKLQGRKCFKAYTLFRPFAFLLR